MSLIKSMKIGQQVVTHQPAISFSISFQNLFNCAGGRTFNVRQKILMEKITGDDGESLWMHETTVDHFAIVVCINEKESDAEALVAEFVHRLPSMWSDFYSTMQSGFADYGHSEEFPPAEFFLSISRMTPDLYMGDKSSFHLRFEFEIEDFSDKLPFYDFYLDDSSKVVHHQPVF